MHAQRTYRYTFTLLLSLVAAVAAARTAKADSLRQDAGRVPFLSGFAVSADLVGISMKGVGARFANMEIAGRLNMKEKFFPIFEIGIGDCTRKGGENSNQFSCTSPYFRLGMDYNVNKKTNGNRFLVGARYGISGYGYDFHSQDMTDPVYGTYVPLSMDDLDGRTQWLELAVGFETKIWRLLRLGWNLRYKMRLAQSVSEYGEPYFVPGYGRNGVSAFGGTVNVVLDFGYGSWGKKHKGKGNVNIGKD